MRTCNYFLRVITPLYGHGQDPHVPQFRLSEVKSLMRFTYRAIKAQNDTKKLYEEEGKMFGLAGNKSTSIASPIRLRLSACQYQEMKDNVLFHGKERGNPRVRYIACNGSFDLECVSLRNDICLDEYKKWFELSFALFGIGGRARRGRGSFSFHSEFLDFKTRDGFISSLLNLLNQKSIANGSYERNHDQIILKKTIKGADYPYIESIDIGKVYSNKIELLSEVDSASHSYNCDFTGYARGKHRYASPVYVSGILINEELRPIIVRLKAIDHLEGSDKSNNFINQILR